MTKIRTLIIALIVFIAPIFIMITQEAHISAIAFIIYGIFLGAIIITKVEKLIKVKQYSKGELKFIFEHGINHYTHGKKHKQESVDKYFNELVAHYDIPLKREP